MTSRSWIRRPCPQSSARLRLFCFPYAGGGASIYRGWGEILPDTIEVCPIQLPGREERLREALFTDLETLVQCLVPIIRPFLDKPFAFFGHSMGALIAYVLTQELWREAKLLPAHLFISSSRAPQLPLRPPIHPLSDSAFLIELQRRYQGVPMLLWQDAELRNLFLPLIRADMTLFETYVYRPASPLPCALTVFGSHQDGLVSQADLAAWGSLVQTRVDLQMFEGNHFYLNTAKQPLLRAIASALNADVV